MTTTTEPAPLTFIDKQANTPLSIWGLSALSLATVPLSARKMPGMPSVIQSLLFSAIYGGAGYVTFVGDHENGAGIATAWCLSWSFLNARTALQSCRPVPLAMVAATSWNILVYGLFLFYKLLMEARRLRILDRQRQASQGWRETLAAYHLLATVFGLVVSCCGAYLITGDLSQTVSMGLLFIGTTVALVSFLAWFGTGQGHAGFLRSYCILVTVSVVLQFTALAWLYHGYTKDPTVVDQLASRFWNFFLKHDDHFLLDLEQAFHCCGYNSKEDRAVPRLLCQAGNTGCKAKWIQLGQQWSYALVLGLAIFLMIQVGALLMTMAAYALVEKETMEEETENQVQKQHVIRFGWLPTDVGGAGGNGNSCDYDASSSGGSGSGSTGGTPRYYNGNNNNNSINGKIRTNRRSQPPPPHYGSLA